MKKLYNVLQAKKNFKGEFLKNKSGKTIYEDWGAIFEDEKGYKKLCLKSLQGDIWLSLFEVKENNSLDDIDDNMPF